jgi:hypothetical protein
VLSLCGSAHATDRLHALRGVINIGACLTSALMGPNGGNC